MILSIIIPVFNEEKTIIELLSLVKKSPLPNGVKKELIVVNDGSTDSTLKLLKQVPGIILKNHPLNQGKGSAMRTGIKASTGDILITQDADLEYDPNNYSNLISPILMKKAKIVYGSRFLGVKKNKRHFSIFKKTHDSSNYFAYLGGMLMTMFTNLLYHTNITDEATGYKVFCREVINKIKIESNGFEFCPELTAKIAKLDYSIYEVPISYKPRSFAEGKKINWKDGFRGLYTLIKYRFNQCPLPTNN